MPSYFSLQRQSSDRSSNRYLEINNCGFHEGLSRMDVRRPKGRLDYQLIYIKEGWLRFDLPQGSVELGGGNVVLYRPGQPQFYSIHGQSVTFFWVHFAGTAVEELLTDFRQSPLHTGEFPEFEQFCKGCCMDNRLAVPSHRLLYEGKLISLIAMAVEKTADGVPRKPDTKIRKALLAMNASPTRRLSNEELAALCGLNRSYFIKLFRQTTALTPQQYYTGLILDQSKALLEATDYSVSEIAALCGVEDSLYFSRLFKKHTGMSPRQYRKGL